MVDLSKLKAASFMPGLQNSGQISGVASISGTLNPTGSDTTTSNMVGTFTITLPDPTVITLMRVNLPDAHGQLASNWFPLIGTAELTDTNVAAQWRLILFIQSDPVGRAINFNFVSLSASVTNTFSNFRINFYAHLYSYPW